jgi:hypothetical protein
MTEGQRLGESLTEGTDFQELTTDKFTEKKTGLQKQIENAENAFRQAQGGELIQEIEGVQQLQDMLPESVETERERKGNYTKYLYNQFLDGTGSAVSGLVDFALAIDKNSPTASPMSKSGLMIDYYRKNNAKGVKSFLKDNIGFEVDKGLEAKYNEGMLTGAIGGLASSAPAMLTGGMTRGLSMVAQMYDGAIQSIESRPDADQWDNDTKTLFAGTLGLIQGQLEKYGLNKVLKGGELTNVIFKKILKSAEGKNITGNILENLIDETVKGVARVFAKGGVRAVDGFASEFYTGAGQEASAIGIENLFDKVTGKPIFNTSNKTDWIGFVDRIAKAGFQEGIGGFVLGGGVGMLSGISKKKVKEGQAVISEIDRQLDNPDTLPEVVEVLIQRKADTQANIDDIVDAEADAQSKMNPDDFAKSQELSKQVEKIDLALQDPNTGESVKADLQSQKKAIESEIDEILKKVPAIAKPTFDTEQQITEEAQQAEAEFNQTDDLVTYEQKMKELNDRANNLVPAPEEAEIGKPEVPALKDVESTTKALKDINFKDNKSLDKVFESISALGLKLEYNKDLILSKENEFDFGYDLQKYFGIRDNGYRKIGDAVIRIKDHTPNYNNFVDDVENGAKKIINVVYGDYNNIDRRKLKTDIDNFEERYPNIEIVDVKIETGDNLEYAIDIIKQDVLPEIAKEYQKGSDKRLVKAVENLLKPQEDAVQVETASQVPVLTEAPVSEEVEQGKPEAKPKVVTEEGVKAEEVTKAPIVLTDIKADIEKRRQEEFIKKAKQVSKSAKNIIESVENGKSQVFTNVLDAAKDVLSNLQAPIGNKSYFEYLQEQVNAKYDAELQALEQTPAQQLKAEKPIVSEESVSENIKQTPAQKVEQLRAEEQAELKAAIPNAEQYLTDGKVDRDKITDAKDLKKFDEIYDKYDKLITPLLPKKEAKVEEVATITPNKAIPANQKLASQEVSKARGIKETDGEVLFGQFKNKRLYDAEADDKLSQIPDDTFIDADNVPPMLKGVYKNLEDKGFIKEIDDRWYLTEKGKDFNDAVQARLSTRKAIKSGTDMFPTEAGLSAEEVAKLAKRATPERVKAVDPILSENHGVTTQDIIDYENNRTETAGKRASITTPERPVRQSGDDTGGGGSQTTPGEAVQEKSTRTLAEIEKNQRQVLAKYHDALKKAGIYESAMNNKANPAQVEKIKNRFKDEVDRLKAEKESVLPKAEPKLTKIEEAQQEVDTAVKDLLDFVKKSRGMATSFANVGEFGAKMAKVFIAYAKMGIVELKDVIAKLREDTNDNFVDENIDAIQDAWNEANGKSKKTLSDFKDAAEKIQAKEEKERLRQEDLELVTPKLEDYESEEPISTSKDFESLAYQAIESKEFRDTLSNKERESGRQLTRAEKRYEVNPLMSAFELGENIVAKAKEEFGDTYVNDLLAYIAKNQNTLGVDKTSLIMLTLENDLNRQLQEDPDNLTLKKQENMVQNLAIAYLRSAARAIGYGKLRQIARVGYDVDEVTSQLFSSEQVESRRKVVKAMESTADEINDEAELQEQEQETEGELVIEEPKVKRDAKQVRADIKEVIKQMRADLVKSARGAGGALSAIPFAQQVKDVTPHIIKLSKLFAELGGMKTKDIVAEIRKSIKGLAPDVDETAITDILKEGKRILTEEQKRKNYIKSLEKDINDLDEQIEQKKRKVVSKEDKYKNDEEIQKIRDVKNGKKDLLDTLDPSYAERVKLKNDLSAAQRSLEEYERKIAENDFETAKKPSQEGIDSTLKELRDKRDSARNEYQDKKKAFEASLITPESIEEKNIDRAIKATEKSIAELERKLAEGDVTVTPKGQSPYSKELGELKQKQAQLRDKLIEERNKAIGKAAPKDRLEQAKDRVNKRIEELKQEIEDKRKELKVVNKVKSDAELDSLLEQEKELKKIANQYLTQESIDRINESKEKSIVTKIENEIAKLDEQIANQQKIQKEKKAPLTTLEITLLKAQRKARIDVLNELDPNPKAFTKQALIDAGYSREITVTTKQGKEKRQVLDWKKLAGKEMDVTAIKNIVEQALKDKGFTPAQISRMQDAFVNEFTELRASVIEKSLKTLRQMNEPKEQTKRKSSARKLAELFDFGLFNQDPDKFNYLLNKILGLSDLDQESFFELNKLSESIKEITLMNSNEFFTRQFIREIQSQVTKVLNKVARQQGSTSFKIVSIVAELHNLGTRTLLLSLKQFFDNQISGRQERLIQNIGLMGKKKMDTKELKKLRSEYASLIKDDIKKNTGLYFGEVNSPFLTKSQIEDYINSMSDNQIWHSLTSIAFGKSYLEAADSMNKAALTERFFTSMLLKVLTDKTNPNKMTPEDALKFVNEQLTGQKFEDALKESAKIINQINTKAAKVILAETKENVFRGAMDLVKANLLVGQALDANDLESAYNAAYTAAGYGLGHEANNPLSLMVNQFQAGLEEKTKAAIKEKEWGQAAALTFGSSIYRNIVNPFVGGGTNWVFLGLQKSGIEPFSPLYYWWLKSKGEIDMSTEIGRKKLENKLIEDYRLKTLNRRLLIGGIASTLVTLSVFASGGDDELEEWLKKNKWANSYKSVFIPQLTLLVMSIKNDTFGKWLEDTFAKSDKFEQLPKIIKGIKEYNKGDGGEAGNAKFMGMLGNTIGSFFNTPLLPVKFARDLGGVYRYIVDKPQEKPDFKNVGFANGFFNYGLIDYMGFRPDRTYMRNMEEYIPESDEKTIKFLRKNDLDINSNSDKAVLSNGIKKSLNETEAQKYDNIWGEEAYRVIKEALTDNEDMDETQIKSLKKVAEFTATRKAQSELDVDNSSLQELEMDGVKYSLTEAQINKRKALIKEYIRDNRNSEKFRDRYREAVKKGNIVGSAESKYFMLMESAKSSATRKMNDIYEKKTSSLQVMPD